jgi:hypothetical protein
LSGIFLTATLAGSTNAAMAGIADHSAYLVDLLRHWIDSHVSTRAHVFGVWEPQKRGALHLHWCICSTDSGGLQYLVDGFQCYWRKLLLDLSAEISVDLFAKNETKSWIDDESKPRCDAGWLRKNPAQYLAKYAGKNSRKEQEHCPYYPSSWLTVDYATKREAVAERLRVVLGGITCKRAESALENILDLLEPHAVNWWHYVNRVYADDLTYIIEVPPEIIDDVWVAVEAVMRHCLTD